MTGIEKEINRFVYSRYILFDELDSTNEYCRSEQVKHDVIVRALRQTSGRGRMGRSFFSEDGGFYISYCYFPEKMKAERLLPLTGLCAVAVSRALSDAAGIETDIKWTNDILLCGKKICGILAESVIGGDGNVERVIMGIGINTNQGESCFQGELTDIASSVRVLTGREVDEERLLISLSLMIHGAYTAVRCEDRRRIEEYVKYYREHCTTLGKEISILRPSLAAAGKDVRKAYAETPSLFPRATAIDIDRNFGLIVQHENGEKETLTFGEVSVR